VQDAKVQLSKREHLLQGQQARIDDLKAKLNQVKKNEEYKAIQNQMAHDRSSMGKLEDEILEGLGQIETLAAALAVQEAEYQKFAAEVARCRRSSRARRARRRRSSTSSRPPSSAPRRSSRRTSASAIADRQAAGRRRDGLRRELRLLGCFVSVTSQMMNELINAHK
jgi:chromosome segregation ATPase